MNADASTTLTDARRRLQASGADTSSLETLASTLTRLVDGQLPEALAQFHDIAGRLSYVADSDFGALLLESLASETADVPLARELLTHASYRARWCAQNASSGGEGMARAIDLHRIDSKLERLK